MQIKTIELGGFAAFFKALRVPFKLEPRSNVRGEYPGGIEWVNDSFHYYSPDYMVEINPKDVSLIQSLIKQGDSHAKCVRGLEVWFEITMPMYFMIEWDTYRIGIDTLSTSSTMHTICKGLGGEELQSIKGEIPASYEYNRIAKVTYQTLRHIYLDRKDHRLPEWKIVIDWIKTLPLAEELIINTSINEIKQ